MFWDVMTLSLVVFSNVLKECSTFLAEEESPVFI